MDVEPSRYGPRLSALVGLLGNAFTLSFSKPQALLDQLLGVEISRGAIATIRQRLSAAPPPLPGKLTPLHPDHFHHQGA
jgi:hypothetical protein